MNVSVPEQLQRVSVVLVIPLLYVAAQSLLIGYEMWVSPVSVILAQAGSLAAYRVALVCAILVLVVFCLLSTRMVYRWAMAPPNDSMEPTQR